jgi:hypothetical protein
MRCSRKRGSRRRSDAGSGHPGFSAPRAKVNTTGYQNIKKIFDMLQYNGTPFQDNIPLVATMFDHYVVLIHGSQYLDSLNAYSYSVDDDVGNFQGTGTGAYI